MALIALTGMKFHAFHGFYPEEKIIGNDFILDVTIEADIEDAGDDDDLSKTLNYEVIHQICKGVMQNPMDLLEAVVVNIKDELQNHFSSLESLQIKLSKMNPPLSGQVAEASVEEGWEFGQECGRCGGGMVCYSNENCWCNSLNIPSATLDQMTAQFGSSCLCPDCMSDYVKIKEE